MKALTKQEFIDLLAISSVRPRLRRELRFVPGEITDWDDRDFLVATTKGGNEGVMILPDNNMRVLSFRLQARKPNAKGRIEAIICDLCATWQRGTHSAMITFDRGDGSSVSFLCCGDLQCSLHVRGKTAASTLSRTQLREDITPQGRVTRLQDRLAALAERI